MHPLNEKLWSDMRQKSIAYVTSRVHMLCPSVSCTGEEARAALEKHEWDVVEAAMEFLPPPVGSRKHDIKLVVEMAKCTEEEARTALEKHEWNVVEATMELGPKGEFLL